jgi:hypothetical protein
VYEANIMHAIHFSNRLTRLAALAGFSILLAACDSGSYTSTTAAPDSSGASGAAQAALSISGSPNAAIVAGASYAFTPSASDAQASSALTYAVQNLPDWASFNAGTGAITGVPSAANVGSYDNIVISVSNGVASAALPAFNIAVQQVGDASATLSWTAPTQNTDGSALTNLAGYHIYYGTDPSNLNQAVTVSTAGVTDYVVTNLSSGTWYFEICAYNSSNVDSSMSAVASETI